MRAYENAVSQLPQKLSRTLLALPDIQKGSVREICMRADKPLCIVTADGVLFSDLKGGFSRYPQNACITSQELWEILRHITQYSLHAYEQELCGGYITLSGGHRAGVSGSAVYKDGSISHIKDVTSINLRVARQVKGISDTVIRSLYTTDTPSVIVLGAPASGKTTVMRDMIRSLASGETGRYVRVSVIDERGELAGARNGALSYDLGITSDILNGYAKKDGMISALRSLSPEVIAIDEIGTSDDAEAIRAVKRSGAAILATAHASSVEDAVSRLNIGDIVKGGAFDYAVVLHGAASPGRIKGIVSLRERAE